MVHGSRFTQKKKETRTDLDRFREIEICLVHGSHGSWFTARKDTLKIFELFLKPPPTIEKLEVVLKSLPNCLVHGSRFTQKKKETRTDLDRFREIEICLVHGSHGSWFTARKRHLENF